MGIPRDEKTLRASKGQFYLREALGGFSASGVAPLLFFKLLSKAQDTPRKSHLLAVSLLRSVPLSVAVSMAEECEQSAILQPISGFET